MGLFSRRKNVAELKAKRDFGALAKVIKKDEEQRDVAAQALIELGDPKAVRALGDLMDDLTMGREDMAAARTVMLELGPDVVMDSLIADLRDGRLGAWLLLTAFDPDVVIRGADAVLAGYADAPPDEHNEVHRARQVVLGGLAKLGTPHAIAILEREIGAGPARREAIRAARSDWEGGEPDVIRALFAVVRDEDEPVLEDVVEALEKLVGRLRKDEAIAEAALPALAGFLDDDSFAVRMVAAVIVAQVYYMGTSDWHKEDPRTSEALAAACADREEGVRWHAATGLACQRDRRSTPALIEMLDSGNGYFVWRGLRGFAMTGDPDGLQAVRRLDQHRRGVDTTMRSLELMQVLAKLEKAEKKRRGDRPYDPPGWYPDPTNPDKERYWAGGEWTEKRR